MGDTSELYCVVKGDISEKVAPGGHLQGWVTFAWEDDFGNSVAPFFTTLKSGRHFLKETNGWQLKCYPITFVVEVIVADIKEETTFYAIDPESREKFKALSPVQFLTDLIQRMHPVGVETRELILTHQDIVPIEALFEEGRDPDELAQYRELLAAADVIFGIDVMSGKQSIMFGRSLLEDLVRTGQSNILGVVNVGLNREPLELEKLAALVQEIKGHHEYNAACAR